ncbi:hypothetical protein W822_19235 [Advenella kashmirensis W13003]|uniref:Uncharacterized protein n=1 Tax=Advenella kashmirensis W13003 TaxID=1424334 RepID=V8QPH7_9BURK|nr:hypothetical protein W822_19235 [Advenella kashmirensis W13003]
MSCVLSGFVYIAFDAFAFVQLKEAFCDSIIVAVPSAAHARLQIMVG